MKLFITFCNEENRTIVVDLGTHRYHVFNTVVYDCDIYDVDFKNDGMLCDSLAEAIDNAERETDCLLADATATFEDWFLYGNVTVEKDMLKSLIGLLSTARR